MNSFRCLQTILTRESILQYPDFTKPFVLTRDATGFAVGAILSQGKIGHDKQISFANRTLNKEQNYSTIEKEQLLCGPVGILDLIYSEELLPSSQIINHLRGCLV